MLDEQRDCNLARKSRKEMKENEERGEARGRESHRAETTNSLIISITYANLRDETGLDAIRSNYFTLAKRLLLAELLHGYKDERG